MKYVIFILFAITALYTSCRKESFDDPFDTIDRADTIPVSKEDTMYIYILAGQSNMDGRVNAASYTGNYEGPIGANGKKAFIRDYMNNPGSFDQLITGTNTSDFAGLAGLQPILGYELVNYKKRDIYFLQPAKGGQAIAAWDSSSALGKWMDSSIVNMPTRAAAMGKKYKFKGFIWFQGESNGGDRTGIYQGKSKALIARVRAKTGVTNLPAIIIQMCDCQIGVSNLSLLQATQAAVAAETNNYLIGKTIGNNCQDALHFSYSGQHDKAMAIFNLVKDF